VAVVLNDVTALHFETNLEDSLCRVGASRGRRVDPQITVGLLTTSTGFPLQVHLFEGNQAETTPLTPVLPASRPKPTQQHRVDVLAGADLR
jgi:transposase